MRAQWWSVPIPRHATLCDADSRGFIVVAFCSAILHHWMCKIPTEVATLTFSITFGYDYFEYLKKDPVKFELFNKSMAAHTKRDIPTIIDALNLDSHKSIIDIGGGTGELLSGIVKHRNITGVLYDLGQVIKHAKANLADDILEKLDLVSGDFISSIPSGIDYHILKFILHDWTDEIAIKILKNSRASINPGGKLFIIEAIVDTKQHDSSAVWHDLHMFSLFNSKEREKKDFEYLLRESDFEINKIITLPRNGLLKLSVIECNPI
ncbi:methyltransferase [Piscirickettsia salmonis]|uniref:methyltransferase n=2 Tax=Piscirickettsia salmonis TaxID=1238 RepID=UPI0015CF64E9|nr:methyltransferase [Piscirickettsia salmonis]